ncbi:MAG: DUF4258 domain-containing protein [Candidatus Krumholzibacteriota bacterium]|nr:DUF4258 domain-containing protein [Candidatus Krumholzibacteriota bacterium]
MNIVYTYHAMLQMPLRGVTESEVDEVLATGVLSEGRAGTHIRQKVLTAGYHWKGRHYAHKEVAIVYDDASEPLVVITVMTRYGFWEGIN